MSAIPELGAGDIAVLRHAIIQVREKGCKFIIFARGFESQKLVQRWLSEVDLTGLTYGEDYVDLGYIPGYEEILYGFFEDLKSVAPTDRYGTPIEDIPMLKGVEGGKDFAYMYASTWGDVRPYATQWGKRCQDAGIPLIVSSLSGGIPMAMPYYRTGTITAFLNSVIAGAGYERLINQPGLGNSLVDAQSMVHLYAILLMVLVQIIYIVRPKTAPRAKDFERGRREGG
jgi:hypothetical protein